MRKRLKKVFRSAIATLLCVCILTGAGVSGLAAGSGTAGAGDVAVYNTVGDYIAQSKAGAQVAAAGAQSVTSTPVGQTTFGNIIAKIVNFISDFVINTIALGLLKAVVPATPKVRDYEDFDIDSYENFYKGTETFIDSPAQGAAWRLGYSERSVLPADFGEKPYRRAGMLPYANTKETFDDLRVRTIVLDDGSGRGKVVFCVIDCIGISNGDVRKIREAVADFAAANHIVSINVSATHTHSGLDTQGVWNDPIGTVFNNLLSATTGLVAVKSGVDATFMQFLIERTAETIEEACGGMKAGSLTYAEKDISDYIRDRTPPKAYDKGLYRLMFTPFDETAKPTLIVSFGCHPETTSYSCEEISADFVYYMEEVVNNAGYNFLFIQGNVSTTTSVRGRSNDGLSVDDHQNAVRYGYEMGYITLGLTLTEAGCAELNRRCGDLLGVGEPARGEEYSIWYEDWTPVAETAVAPVLNIRMEQVILECEQNLAGAMGKNSLTNNLFILDKSTNTLYSVTEIGYMEIGTDLKVLLSPGELYSELLVGGDGLKGFPYESLRDTYGENLIVFDLVNDAIGYVVPDQNYVMVGMQYDEANDTFVSDSWCFLVSMGRRTGSSLIGKYHALIDSVR